MAWRGEGWVMGEARPVAGPGVLAQCPVRAWAVPVCPSLLPAFRKPWRSGARPERVPGFRPAWAWGS